MTEIVSMLGQKGIILLVGVIVFLFIFKYSIALFDWIEHQTYGTRSYIQEKLEFLFIEIPQEKLTYMLLASSVGVGALVFLFFGILSSWVLGIILGLFCAFIGFKAPRMIVDHLVQKRIKTYSGQMVDALQLLANGIRAGLSLPQAVGMVVEEMPAPISQEFSVLLQQNRVGVPLEECFENLAKRVPLEDNDMFVAAINILRETGGNLSEVFDTIVGVIRERVRLQQKVDTYIAQGMFQGMTIGAMPYLLGLVYAAQDPESMKPMFTHPLGWALLIVAVGLDAAGIFVIFKIVKIKM